MLLAWMSKIWLCMRFEIFDRHRPPGAEITAWPLIEYAPLWPAGSHHVPDILGHVRP